MSRFQRVCVYCGSSNHVDRAFLDAALGVGRLIAERGLGVVYGGGSVGLMNQVAEGALRAGGEVIGVIPKKLMALELGRGDLTELRVVDGMHSRKRVMAELSDAFIALPGGYGTLEELFEVTTWTQLNYHRKPVGLLNVAGYFDHLVAFLDRASSEGFIRQLHRGLISVDTDAAGLLARLESQRIPDLKKWIEDP